MIAYIHHIAYTRVWQKKKEEKKKKNKLKHANEDDIHFNLVNKYLCLSHHSKSYKNTLWQNIYNIYNNNTSQNFAFNSRSPCKNKMKSL